MTLKRFYESHFGFRYNERILGKFESPNFYQWRDISLDHFSQIPTILEVIILTSMVPSKSEAKRLISSGGIRVGLADESTHFSQCKKLTEDRLLEPNDLIRIGLKGLWVRPPKPTIFDELNYLWDKVKEKFDFIVLRLRGGTHTLWT